MPDQLNDRLMLARRQLIDSISQPELATISARAGRLRRRRRSAVVLAAVIAAAVFVGGALWQPWRGSPGRTPPAAGQEPSGGPIWHDQGITVTGLPHAIQNLPGQLSTVEFADADHGFLLTTDCVAAGCRVRFAATSDGGQSWHERTTPLAETLLAGDAPPALLTFDGRVAIAEEPASVPTGRPLRRYSSDDAGLRWQTDPVSPAPAPVTAIPRGAHPYIQATDPVALRGCHGGRLAVWTVDAAQPLPLAQQPPMQPCWAGSRPAGDGSWWVGGIAPGSASGPGRPAVAVSRDEGRSWTVTMVSAQPIEVSGVRVATLGEHVYAVVLGSRTGPDVAPVRAIYHSTDRGARFSRSDPARVGEPSQLAGDLVPLLDGRLLLVAGNGSWYVSADDGATFAPARTLGRAGRLARTGAGYVVYGLFGGGWCAYSPDGSTWHKLDAY